MSEAENNIFLTNLKKDVSSHISSLFGELEKSFQDNKIGNKSNLLF